jgi:SIR2-like protein
VPPAAEFTWTDREWNQLITKVELQRCTPFLGAGASYPTLRLGSEIARDWAHRGPYDYPFADDSNLARVAQYIAVEEEDIDVPKDLILKEFRGKGPPTFSRSDEIHRVVADLELPVYITTNYDDFMTKALNRINPKRVPQQVFCNWHLVRSGKIPKIKLSSAVTPATPLVFHLHGHLGDIDSLVLTEDDYLDFLISLSEAPTKLLPPVVEGAFSTSSFLFLGYSLEDLDFKVIFRKLATYPGKGRKHFSVQLQPKAAGEPPSAEEIERAKKQLRYLSNHLGRIDVKVFWGTCQDFAAELHKYWSKRASPAAVQTPVVQKTP